MLNVEVFVFIFRAKDIAVSQLEHRRTHTHTQFYTNCKRTVFDTDAGENAIFGSPWSPDEGVLYVNIGEHVQEMILRVMDYEWLKSDAVIGEILVNISSVVGRGATEAVLTRNGQKDSGTVEFCMNWETESESVDLHGRRTKCLRVQIFKAVGLRKAQFFGKNASLC
jgi:hypothetical protein